MTYQDKAEATREFYRIQGESRMLEIIIADLEKLERETPNAAWSPAYIIKRLKSLSK
jgi:hypothetical protein